MTEEPPWNGQVKSISLGAVWVGGGGGGVRGGLNRFYVATILALTSAAV